jgi:hypothetical protein
MSTARRMTFRLCLAIVVAASIATAAAGQEKANLYGLVFPAEVAGFTFRETYSFEKEKPGLGYDVTYTRPGWLADIYIYDLGLKSIPEDPRSERIRAQFEQAEGDIFNAQQRGQYKTVALRARFAVADAKGRARLACGTFKLRRSNDKKDSDSYLCVTGWNNKFVKLRITVPAGGDNDATALRFLSAWVNILSMPSTPER